MNEEPDFLDGQVQDQSAPAVEPAASDPAPGPEGGNGASVQPAEAQAEPVAQAPAAPVEEKDPMAPVRALLDERDKRQAIQRERDELARRLDQIDRQRREAAEKAPNMLDDPEAYHAYLMNQIAATKSGFAKTLDSVRIEERMATSEMIWSQKLGEEEWKALNKWIGETWGDAAHKHAMRQRDPYGWAFQQFDQDRKARRAEDLTKQLGDKDLDAFLEAKKAEWLAEQAAAEPKSQPEAAEPSPSQPRKSNGQFDSPSNTQRRSVPNLTDVNGAAAPNGADQRSAFDQAFS